MAPIITMTLTPVLAPELTGGGEVGAGRVQLPLQVCEGAVQVSVLEGKEPGPVGTEGTGTTVSVGTTVDSVGTSVSVMGQMVVYRGIVLVVM
jgi:hypothetical protein